MSIVNVMFHVNCSVISVQNTQTLLSRIKKFLLLWLPCDVLKVNDCRPAEFPISGLSAFSLWDLCIQLCP